MTRLHLFRAAAVVLGFACATAALSAPVSGTFAGVAYGSRVDAWGPNPGNFDGMIVTGTFWLDTSSLPAPTYQDSVSSFTMFPPELMRLTFSVPGQQTVVFNGSDGNNALFLTNDANGQSVEFAPDFSFPYWFASLQLAGPLFEGVDPKTLKPGPIDLSGSSAGFFAGRSFGAGLDLTSVQFDAPLEVPEPETAVMLMAGLALLAWVRLRAGLTVKQRR